MRKVSLFFLTLCMAIASNAQDLPYSKYLNFSKAEFKENNFKYHEKTNTWYINKTNGLNEALTILAILADAEEDIRPDVNDYTILVPCGREDVPSCVRVTFYNDETYHKLLTFIKRHGKDLMDTTFGKSVKYVASYGDYELELQMDQHIISRTSARTADPKTVKNVDESYNEYEFIIRTSVEPWSRYIEKQEAKQAKRDAKGKKKIYVDDMM